jgi:hypothetical protein
MRKVRLAILTTCLLLPLNGLAVTQDVPTVSVTAERAVLGQVVPVTVTIANPTSELVVMTRLELRRNERLIHAGHLPTWGSFTIPPGETRTIPFSLLWNYIPARDVEREPRLYPDPVVFREPGSHELTLTVALNWGEPKEIDGIRRLDLRRIGEPAVVRFNAEVLAPERKADRAWWRLVSADPAFAEFIQTGAYHKSVCRDRVKQQVRQFIKTYPTDKLGADLDSKLRRGEALKLVEPTTNR